MKDFALTVQSFAQEQHGGGAAGFADTVGASKPTERGLCEGREDSEEYMDCQ
jgi:hypothetical protein